MKWKKEESKNYLKLQTGGKKNIEYVHLKDGVKPET